MIRNVFGFSSAIISPNLTNFSDSIREISFQGVGAFSTKKVGYLGGGGVAVVWQWWGSGVAVGGGTTILNLTGSL